MGLRNNDRPTDLDIKHYLDQHSPSLCLAKWYNATIWLGSGQTTSCHHPPAHQISIDEIAVNPSAIHNTQQKKKDRNQMLYGERPPGCDYCWKIEDIGPEAISDRVYKSMLYEDKDVEEVYNSHHSEDFNLKTLEIAFDRTCNFACSYCNPAFSSSWVKDIKSDGPYTGLLSDGRNHFTHTHDGAEPFGPDEENPYVEAFFKWWESDLHESLQELRLTGGEPLMSKHTWRLLDMFIDQKPEMTFALNSNLCAKDDTIDKLIEASHSISDFHLYTSNESMGDQAEYIRDGLDWEQWSHNIDRLLREGNVKQLHMMCTINALCLDGLTDFLDYCIDLKSEYGKSFPTFTLNILRFPSFQSPLILPLSKRMHYAAALKAWLVVNKKKHGDLLHEIEINHINRLVEYLNVFKTHHTDEDLKVLRSDFRKFYRQYDERRGKHFRNTFRHLSQWYDDIEEE